MKLVLLGKPLGNSEVYSYGSLITPNHNNAASMKKTLEDVEVFTYDFDGCLFDKAYDTAKCETRVEEYLANSKELVEAFKLEISKMASLGVKIAICTGRALSWVRRVVPILFPEDVDLLLVLESGSDLLYYDSTTKEYSQMPADLSCITQFDLDIFLEIKVELETMMKELGLSVEEGKDKGVSGNVPKGSTETIEDAFIRVCEEVKKRGYDDKIDVTHSDSAIDIIIKGSGKAKAINKIAGKAVVGSVADNVNDFELLEKESHVMFVPQNSKPKVKSLAKNAPLGIIAEEEFLPGVNQMLQFFNQVLALE